MNFLKNKIHLSILSICYAIIISFSIYNIEVILEYATKSTIAPFKEKDITKFILYFLFSFVITRNKEKSNFWILFLPIFAIDSTTVLFGPNLIPLRFPYASIYPFLGILCGMFLRNKLKLFYITFSSSLIFFFLSNQFIIPSILWYMHKRNNVSNKINLSISNANLTATNGKSIMLFDTLKCNPALIEFYFVGCKPCDEKYEYLKLIHDKYKIKGLNIILICDGTASSIKSFLNHWNKIKYKDIIFLYDENELSKKYKIEGFPTEIIINQKKFIVNQEKGFGKLFAHKWLKKEETIINNILQIN